jgi:hypothetical protein
MNSYWRSPYGDLAVSNTGDSSLELTANYNGAVEFEFEAPTTPNFYAVNFELLTGENSWQSQFFYYEIEGDYGYINDLQLMPDEIYTGTDLSVLTSWRVVSDDPDSLYALELEAEGELSSCVANGARTFSGEPANTAINIVLENSCDSLPGGSLTAYLRDSENNLLDERSINIPEDEAEIVEEPVVPEEDQYDQPVLLVIGTTISTLLLIIIGVTLSKRRRENFKVDSSQDEQPLQ